MKKVFAAVLFLGVMTGFAVSSHKVEIQSAEAVVQCLQKNMICQGSAMCCSHVCALTNGHYLCQ